MDQNRKKKVCYILSYYSPEYVRTKTLTEALKRMDDLVLYQARNSTAGIFRYFQTLGKLFFIRMVNRPDYFILGFRGYEIFWIVRVMTLGKPLIFDHMMSPYDSLLNERKKIKKGGIVDKLVYIYEWSILHHSDIILTDTTIHKDYFAKLFQINPKKIHTIHVGTDEDLFNQMPSKNLIIKKRLFEVLFYGSFLPLHGVDIILKAASILGGLPIHFTIIGGNRVDLSSFYQLMEQLKCNNVVHKEWIDYAKLPELICQSEMCLGGPFGNTGQARRVVTGKTFQFLAMGKPTVVGEIDQNYGFENKRNCLLVPQGNEQALAEAILWGFNHRDELKSIGQQGRELYMRHFSLDNIKENLQVIL